LQTRQQSRPDQPEQPIDQAKKNQTVVKPAERLGITRERERPASPFSLA